MNEYQVEITLKATVFAEDSDDLADIVENAFEAPPPQLRRAQLLTMTERSRRELVSENPYVE